MRLKTVLIMGIFVLFCLPAPLLSLCGCRRKVVERDEHTDHRRTRRNREAKCCGRTHSVRCRHNHGHCRYHKTQKNNETTGYAGTNRESAQATGARAEREVYQPEHS